MASPAALFFLLLFDFGENRQVVALRGSRLLELAEARVQHLAVVLVDVEGLVHALDVLEVEGGVQIARLVLPHGSVVVEAAWGAVVVAVVVIVVGRHKPPTSAAASA